MPPVGAVFTPSKQTHNTALTRAIHAVGLMIDTKLSKPVDVVRATRQGLPPDLIDVLVDKGFSRKDLNWIVPSRTLRHRREKHEKLTPEESDRFLRAAKLYALAVEVFGDTDKAMQWLAKPRAAFDNHNALEFMQSETGGDIVEEQLCQLDAGYFA
jgi:putative toxin-antitoxin system antitoxin component (TIGR02293 family)